ncbi:MAG TPA: biotin-dependent carboxyltransferase family protein [Actinotalea sp.]|nr:biotin-dependent carboxyltransferase family protein [Actinotalea sp.]
MTPTLEVLATGPLVLVQDEGRAGHAAVGVGPSGAADRSAYRLGARLVGHGEGRAALEVLLGGLSVRAHGRVTAALTGAPAPATVDGRPVGHASLVEVPDGSVLTLGMPSVGVRSYLTVRGGFAVAPVLGSRSTDTLSGVGPPPVRPGDHLPIGHPGPAFPHVDQVAHPAHAPGPAAADGRPVVLEVLPGPRSAWVGGWGTGLGGLLTSTWEVAGHSDRIGVRLSGSRVHRATPWRDVELPSEGLVRGGVQLPPGGEPVLFLADHPVTGGYPVVAVLTASAVDRAAQLRPGDPVRLVAAAKLTLP